VHGGVSLDPHDGGHYKEEEPPLHVHGESHVLCLCLHLASNVACALMWFCSLVPPLCMCRWVAQVPHMMMLLRR